MRCAVLLLLFVALVVADPQFDKFLAKYGKSYSGQEYLRRQKIYHSNIRRAERLNAINDVFGETMFSDLTEEEFKATYLLDPMPSAYYATSCLIEPDYLPNPMATPDSWDWTNEALTGKPHVVLPVKDQGSCGSCWAFSTVQAIEGQIGMLGLYDQIGDSLSPKYITDCSKGCTTEIYLKRNLTVCNDGCNGGWPWSAFDDLATVSSPTHIGGVPTETSYPYSAISISCKPTTGKTVSIGGYVCVTTSDMDYGVNEGVMADYLFAAGPLSITLNANYFNSYRGGIMNIASCTGGVLNHAVLLVGFGVENGTPYWRVKNSWGTSWGEAGYIRIYRGNGMCGINEGVSYPVTPIIA